MHEIQSRLPKPLKRVNLNNIKREDADDFNHLLDRSGINVPGLRAVIDRCKDFREVVVTLYNNEAIRNKIQEELGPLLENPEFKNVFVVSNLVKWVGHDVDAAFLRSVTQTNAYGVISGVREVAGDIFALDDDSLLVRSALFSEYLIQNFLQISDIIDCVYDIIVEAVKRKDERRCQAILSSLMRFSNLKRALKHDPNYSSSLRDLFERLHRDIGVNEEPLFWLQFSILMTDADDLSAAEVFINTAYKRAEASPGFQTFQIDTYALKLLLLIEQRIGGDDSVGRFKDIIDKLGRVRSMIGEESRRFHAIEVLKEIEPFVAARIAR